VIRKATYKDIKGLVDLCKEAHSKSVNEQLPVDNKTLIKSLQVIVLSREHCCYVTEVDGRIVGAIIGVTHQSWFSKKKQASDLFFYTSERGRGSGPFLFRRFVTWVRKESGAKQIILSTDSGIDSERTSELYTRMGCKKIGDVFHRG